MSDARSRSAGLLLGGLAGTILAIVLAATPLMARADSPAALADAGTDRAQAAFTTFAEAWMAKLARAETQNRQRPGANGSAGVQYRGFGKDFRTELRATGNAQSPYVGVLHYVEHVYQCSDARVRDCRVASSVPVMEIFRYRDGRWLY